MSVALVGPTLAMSGNGQGLIGTVGKAIPLVFLIGLVGVSLVGYSFVRLTRHLNHAGSAYGLVGGTIGPRTGFFSGFAMLGAYCGLRHRHPGLDRRVRQRVHRRTAGRATTTRTSCRGWSSSSWAPSISFLLSGRDIRLLAKILLAIEGVGILSMIVLVVVIFAKGGAPTTGVDFSAFSFDGVSASAVTQRRGRGLPVVGRIRGLRVDG